MLGQDHDKGLFRDASGETLDYVDNITSSIKLCNNEIQ